jgi:hypothetical protein
MLTRTVSAVLMALTPAAASACTIAHVPERSTDTVVAVDVRMVSGEGCVIYGSGEDPPWFRTGEKMSAYKGRYGRLVHRLHNRDEPTKARWQYVYVSPKGWTGRDTVGIAFEVPRIEYRYDLVIGP